MGPAKHGYGYPFDCCEDTDDDDDDVDVLTDINTIKQIVQRLSVVDSGHTCMATNLKLLRDLITNLISVEEKRNSNWVCDPTSAAERRPTSRQSANNGMVCEMMDCMCSEDYICRVPPSTYGRKKPPQQEANSKSARKSEQEEYRKDVNCKTQPLPTKPRKSNQEEEKIIQKPDSGLEKSISGEEEKVEQPNESINKDPKILEEPNESIQDNLFTKSSVKKFADEKPLPSTSFLTTSHGSSTTEDAQVDSSVSKSKREEQKLIADQGNNESVDELSMATAAVQTSFTSRVFSKDAEVKVAEETALQPQKAEENDKIKSSPTPTIPNELSVAAANEELEAHRVQNTDQIQTYNPPALRELSFAAAAVQTSLINKDAANEETEKRKNPYSAAVTNKIQTPAASPSKKQSDQDDDKETEKIKKPYKIQTPAASPSKKQSDQDNDKETEKIKKPYKIQTPPASSVKKQSDQDDGKETENIKKPYKASGTDKIQTPLAPLVKNQSDRNIDKTAPKKKTQSLPNLPQIKKSDQKVGRTDETSKMQPPSTSPSIKEINKQEAQVKVKKLKGEAPNKDTADGKAEESAVEDDGKDEIQPPHASRRSKRLSSQEALGNKSRKNVKDKLKKGQKEKNETIPNAPKTKNLSVVVATQTSFICRVSSKDTAYEEMKERKDDRVQSSSTHHIKKCKKSNGSREVNDKTETLNPNEDGTAANDKIKSSHQHKRKTSIEVQTSSSGRIFNREAADKEAKDNVKEELENARPEQIRSQKITEEDQEDQRKQEYDKIQSSPTLQTLFTNKNAVDDKAEEQNIIRVEQDDQRKEVTQKIESSPTPITNEAEEIIQKEDKIKSKDKMQSSLTAPHKKKSSVVVAVQTSSTGRIFNKDEPYAEAKDQVKEELASARPENSRSQNIIREDQERRRREETEKIRSSLTPPAQPFMKEEAIEENNKIPSLSSAPHLKKPSIAVAVQTSLASKVPNKDAADTEETSVLVSKEEPKHCISRKSKQAESAVHINKEDQEDDITALKDDIQSSSTEPRTRKSSAAAAVQTSLINKDLNKAAAEAKGSVQASLENASSVNDRTALRDKIQSSPTEPHTRKSSVTAAVQTSLISKALDKDAAEAKGSVQASLENARSVNDKTASKDKIQSSPTEPHTRISSVAAAVQTSLISKALDKDAAEAKGSAHASLENARSKDDRTDLKDKVQSSSTEPHARKSSVAAAVQTSLISNALAKDAAEASLENARSKDEPKASISKKLEFAKPIKESQEIIQEQEQEKVNQKLDGDLNNFPKETKIDKPNDGISKEQTKQDDEPDDSNNLQSSKNLIQDQEFADKEPLTSKSSLSTDSHGSSSGEEEQKEYVIAIQKGSFQPKAKNDEQQIIEDQRKNKKLEEIVDQNDTKELDTNEDQDRNKETKKNQAATENERTKSQDVEIQTDITKIAAGSRNETSISSTNLVDTGVQTDLRKDAQKTQEALLGEEGIDSLGSDVSLIPDQKPSTAQQKPQSETMDSDENEEEDEQGVIAGEFVNNARAREEDDDDFENIEDEIFKSDGKEYPPDRRLELWKRTVEARQRIAENIMNQTGKRPSDILFNRLLTSEEQDKQMVQRIMDCADRMNPTRKMTKRSLKLREFINERNQYIRGLDATVPRLKRKMVISGVPDMVKKELMGTDAAQGKNKSRWMKSPVLAKRINEKQRDIRRVIDFYPDISCLSVAGKMKPIMIHFHTGPTRRYNEQRDSCCYGVSSYGYECCRSQCYQQYNCL